MGMGGEFTPEELKILRENCKDKQAFTTVMQLLAAHERQHTTNAVAHPLPESDKLRETAEMLRVESAERKRAQDALRYSEANLRAILDNTPLSFLLISPDYQIITANRLAQQRALAVFGKSLDPGVSIYEFVLDRDMELFNLHFHQALSGQQSIVVERDFIDVTGNQWYFQFIYQPVIAEDGQLFGVCLITEDITQRKKYEIALRESEARLRSVTHNYPNGVISMFDHDLRFMLVDGLGFTDIFSEKDAMIGKTIYEIFDEEVLAILEPVYQRALSGVEVTIEVSFKEHYYLTHSVPIHNDDGEIIAGLTISQDITERKLAEQRKIDLQLEKERIRILTDFIRDASHEFRTPLSTIKSGLHLVTHPSLTAHQQEHVAVMEDQVERIVNLVEGLVKMSYLDNPVNLKFDAMDLNDAIAIALDVATKGYITQIKPALDDKLPYIYGNMDELIRAVKNVLENALRYTPDDGLVTVRTYCYKRMVVLEIEDTGIGIEDRHLPHIFKRFFRVDTAHTTAGLGLGLSITRKIIEHHGGTIDIESTYGRGTVVRISLPALPKNDFVDDFSLD